MSVRSAGPADPTALPARAHVAALLGIALLLALYPLLRYQGLWGEGDTALFTRVNRLMVDTGQIEPRSTIPLYPNGYAFQALATFIVSLTGLSVATLQLYGSSLLMVWTVVPAWMLYRVLLGSHRGATLATAILYVQPEFLFPILRGTHEKFSRGLMLLCLFLIVCSIRSRHRPARFAGFVLAFYVSAYALLSLNSLLGGSLVVATGLALALSWMALRILQPPFPAAGATLRRLAYGSTVTMALALLIVLYVYRPAQHDLLILQSIGDRVAIVFLGAPPATPGGEGEREVYNPYAAINTGWISPRVYLLVSLANWLTLAISAVVWSWQSLTWLFRRRWPRRESDLLLWAFYGAFALEGAGSVVADLSGSLAGNLQHRIFPSFVMVAVPVVASWLLRWAPRPRPLRLIGIGLGMVCLAVLAMLSLFKATNEPLLSNKWLFSSPAELAALSWAEVALVDQWVWLGFDERLPTVSINERGGAPHQVSLDTSAVDPGTRDFLVSDIMREQGARFGLPLPLDADNLVTYDNGQAQIQHTRPRTPYQK